MSIESLSQRENLFIPRPIEISLTSERETKKLEDWLRPLIGVEEAEQCVFILRSIGHDDFTNRCKDATQKFGQELSKRFGDEKSFFELVPSARFSDVRSYSPLTKVGYKGDYHSVGVLELRSPQKQTFSLTFDLTYGNISNKSENDNILVLYSPGDKEQATRMLQKKYGGSWKTELELDQKTGKFLFCEK